MKTSLISFLFSLLVISSLLVFDAGTVACSPSNDQDTSTGPQPPPPPPVPPPVINKVDVYQVGTTTNYAGSWLFSYDSRNRVTSIIDNHSQGVLNDTMFYYFDYQGTNSKPSRLRFANVNYQFPVNPFMDTLFFTYDANGNVTSDDLRRTELAPDGSFFRRLRIRNYSYLPNVTIVQWYSIPNGETQLRLYRIDSLMMWSGNIYEYAVNVPYGYLLGNNGAANPAYRVKITFPSFQHVKNPLSTLNITGNPFTWFRKRSEIELMGNWTYTAYWNSTVLPDFFDLCSADLPGTFGLQNYMGDGYFLNTNQFTLTAYGPYVNNYPSSFRVQPTSGAADAFAQEYRFTYR